MKRFFKLSIMKNLKLKWIAVVSLLIASFACYPPDSLLPTLNMSKTTYEVNETIVVNYSNLSGNSTDCVGIFVEGTSNEAFLQCIYSNGDENGTMSFDGLPTAGEYNASRKGTVLFSILHIHPRCSWYTLVWIKA
ncbi:MAG: hypothetical protein ACMUIP_18065 [bacterium]